MEFDATLVEAPPFKWKVQCWESAGNIWSQQQASACAAGEAGSCASCLSSMGYSSWASHSAIPAVAFLSPGAAVSHCSGLKLWAMVWGFVLPLLIFPSSCQLTHFLNPGGLGPFFSLFLGNLFFRREKIDCGISDIPAALQYVSHLGEVMAPRSTVVLASWLLKVFT